MAIEDIVTVTVTVRASLDRPVPASVDVIAECYGHEALNLLKSNGSLVEIDGVWHWPKGAIADPADAMLETLLRGDAANGGAAYGEKGGGDG